YACANCLAPGDAAEQLDFKRLQLQNKNYYRAGKKIKHRLLRMIYGTLFDFHLFVTYLQDHPNYSKVSL
ncbi:hypothetical protein O9G_006290, partial [Rozella allomycis CSF55]